MLLQYQGKYPKFGGVYVGYDKTKLPPYTIRLKYKQGITPTFSIGTGVLYDAEQNIWDLTYENGWADLLQNHTDLLEVIDANSEGVISTVRMFSGCTSLTSVSLFDTSMVDFMTQMFYNCQSLTSIPLFDTSKAISMFQMFAECYNVQSGALALYQQASTQTNPPTTYQQCFRACGRDTETGSAELEQIPASWK